jgi:hypothetical protein
MAPKRDKAQQPGILLNFGCEARLAEAGFAGEQDDLAAAARGQLQALLYRRELLDPADEGGAYDRFVRSPVNLNGGALAPSAAGA